VVAAALIAFILSQADSLPDLLSTIAGSLTIGLGAALYEFRRARQQRMVVARNRAERRANRPRV
jgi:hypothetical protein